MRCLRNPFGQKISFRDNLLGRDAEKQFVSRLDVHEVIVLRNGVDASDSPNDALAIVADGHFLTDVVF